LTEERFRLMCCLVRLEAARYDVFATSTMIRQLNSSPLTEKQIHSVCALQGHVYQMRSICKMVEISIQKTELGREMLADFNGRMPELSTNL